MKITMIKIVGMLMIASCLFGAAACGNKQAANTSATNGTNKTTSNENKSATENKSTSTTSNTTGGAASTVVKDIYDSAMKRNCSAILPMLTDEFRKGVGTSKDEMDALCDSFTDSGKLASYEVKGEELKGDSGVVKVLLTYKDGKKEEKEEKVKKADGKWLMDS